MRPAESTLANRRDRRPAQRDDEDHVARFAELDYSLCTAGVFLFNSGSREPITLTPVDMVHPHRFVTVFAILSVLASGCEEAARVPPEPSAPTTSSTLDESALSIILHIRLEVEAGEPVPLAIVVRNVSQQPVYLETGDSTTTFDIQVADRSGAMVWRRMHERESLTALHQQTLAPGEEVRFTDTWDQRSNSGARVPPGRYEVHGTLDAQGDKDLVTAPVHMVIAGRR
jgi:hypothetical protein